MELYPWLRNVPPHWQIARLGHVAKITTGTADVQDSFDDGEYPFFIRSPKVKRLAYFTHDTEAVLTAGDGNVGDIFHHFKGKFVAHQRVYIVEPGPLLYGRYLYYVMMQSFKDSLSGNTAKSTVESLRRPMLTSFQLPLPPLEEQKQIANELDRELAEIDELIADQQRLLELATEKFNAELRQLTYPANVPTVPLKRFAQITLGKMITPSDKGGMELAPYIRAANIQPGGVFTYQSDHKKMWFSSDELAHLDLKKGDVLVVEGGAGFGRSAILEEDLPGWGFQNSINRVRVRPGLADANYINFCIRAQLLSGELENLTNQSTIPHLTAEKLALVNVPALNINQQKNFSENALRLSSVNLSLINELSKLISILKELKANKIYGAVQ